MPIDKTKLQSSDKTVVRSYVEQKFRSYSSWHHSKAWRTKKCIAYWHEADGTMHGQQVVQDVYFHVFKEPWPVQNARVGGPAPKMAAIAGPPVASKPGRGQAPEPKLPKAPKPPKVSSGLDPAENRRAELDYSLKQLRFWSAHQSWQEGERFLTELRSHAELYIEPRIFEESEFQTQWESRRQVLLTGSASIEELSAEANFDAMIGYRQASGVQFKTKPHTVGRLSGSLEQFLRAGAWAQGSAKAELSPGDLAIAAEISLAMAIGAEFDIRGTLDWEKGDTGLRLAGQANLFAGARGSLEASLNASLREGFAAAFKAEAFAGVSASVEGSCAITRNGAALVTATGTAEVSFGIGGRIEGSIEASIFGGTEISFEANATFGVGGGVGTKVEIDFNGIYLAGREDFRRLMYLPTLARGYQATLINQDHKNRFYLEKCIKHVERELAELDEAMEHEESRGLLLGQHGRSDD